MVAPLGCTPMRTRFTAAVPFCTSALTVGPGPHTARDTPGRTGGPKLDHLTPLSVGGQRASPLATASRTAPADFGTIAQGAAAAIAADPGLTPRSLYIHTPFCEHKCHYCDFYSLVDTRDRQAAFTNRLALELTAIAPLAAGPLRTIFVGGGTPSLLRVELWRGLLGVLRDRFDLSDILAGREGSEFTVECNPESLTAELMGVLVEGGVNRVSVGAQSFEPRHLRTLQRLHRPERVAEALEVARRAGVSRRSLDLIYAIPGQTLDEWARDVRTALEIGTTHLSAYNLTYEPNTAMTARLHAGEFDPVDEDLEVEMFTTAARLTGAAGLDRYEVSNYAAPGHACRHNLAYWRQEPWLAAGPSASGHLAGHRWKNAPRLDTYLERGRDGFAPIVDHEPPDPRRALAEVLMTGLRLAEGVDAGTALSRAGAIGREGALRAAADLEIGAGLMRLDPAGRWVLDDSGIVFADGIAARLMHSLGG